MRKMNIATWIKENRHKMGFSKYALSKLIGVSPIVISNWENSIYEPNEANKYRLSRLFNDATIITNDDFYNMAYKAYKRHCMQKNYLFMEPAKDLTIIGAANVTLRNNYRVLAVYNIESNKIAHNEEIIWQ
jgi:DNA-binding XRE family transcriptional regulator